jgi:hypothetical protein
MRQRASSLTTLLIAGKPVDPWHVGINLTSAPVNSEEIELNLGIPIVVDELRQCGVQVDENGIIQFVRDDIAKYQNQALEGYLTFARYIINPPPLRKSYGWFARMFTPAPKFDPPPVQWNWTRVDEITGDNQVLVIKGRCWLRVES